MENESNNAKQLLILGNGFDKACGLKSDYSDSLMKDLVRLTKNL